MIKRVNLYDQSAKGYDSFIRTMNPHHDEMQDKILEALLYYYPQRKVRSVMELGLGTGMLAFKILSEITVQKYKGFEISKNLSALAIPKLSFFRCRVAVINEDFRSAIFLKNCDSVISTMTFHYLPNRDKKLMFKKVYGALKHNGIFIIGDRTISKSNFLQQIFKQRMIDSWDKTTKHWCRDIRKVHNTADDPKEEPYYLDDQLTWLREAGFSEVECIWRNYNYCVIYGIKG